MRAHQLKLHRVQVRPGEAEVKEVEVAQISDTSSSSSEETDEDSSDSSCESEKLGVSKVRHTKLGTVHALHKGDKSRTACGRIIHSLYEDLDSDEEVTGDAMCGHCFGVAQG